MNFVNIKSIKKIKKPEKTYNLHIEDNHNYFANGMMVANCHKARGENIQKISTMIGKTKKDLSTMKIGLSGTLPPNLFDQLSVESALGQSHRIISAKELIDLGLATQTSIQPVILRYNDETRKKVKKMDWHEENKFIIEHEGRIDFISKFAKKMSTKGNVLVLAKNVSLQNAFYDAIKKDHEHTFLISGSVKGSKRESSRQEFDKHSDSILVGSVAIVSTGLNLKSLKYVILGQVTKSEILTIQTLGRAMRLHDTKESSTIFDIVDDIIYTTRTGREYNNYYLKHFYERQQAYRKYEFEVAKPISLNIETDIF